MRIYYFMLEENQNQFEKVETTSKNQFGILPKVYCTPEDIRDYCRYTIEARISKIKDPNKRDKSILYDINKITKAEIDLYKSLKCYQKQSESKRKEVIDYIIKEPLVKEYGIMY